MRAHLLAVLCLAVAASGCEEQPSSLLELNAAAKKDAALAAPAPVAPAKVEAVIAAPTDPAAVPAVPPVAAPSPAAAQPEPPAPQPVAAPETPAAARRTLPEGIKPGLVLEYELTVASHAVFKRDAPRIQATYRVISVDGPDVLTAVRLTSPDQPEYELERTVRFKDLVLDDLGVDLTVCEASSKLCTRKGHGAWGANLTLGRARPELALTSYIIDFEQTYPNNRYLHAALNRAQEAAEDAPAPGNPVDAFEAPLSWTWRTLIERMPPAGTVPPGVPRYGSNQVNGLNPVQSAWLLSVKAKAVKVCSARVRDSIDRPAHRLSLIFNARGRVAKATLDLPAPAEVTEKLPWVKCLEQQFLKAPAGNRAQWPPAGQRVQLPIEASK